MVRAGDSVTIFTSCFSNCEREITRAGIQVIREGGKFTVYSRARQFVKKHLADYDMIVDEINTVPFGANRVAGGKPVVALIHQLAREVWFYETKFPLALLGYYGLEPFWLRQYRLVPTVTVSASTRQDLVKRGFTRVSIVHNGIGITPLEKPPIKESNPILMFVGRLVKSKLPNHALLAFKEIRGPFPSAELWVVGDGYMKKRLEGSAGNGVRFFGRVTDKDKFELLKRAHALLFPSVREGWGNSVIEANAMGTPAIGYDVPGLRDSIVHGVTGLLAMPMSPYFLARAAEQILRNVSQERGFAHNALEWSRKFSWERAAEEFGSALRSVHRDP